MSTAGSTGSTASVCDVRHSGPNFRGLSMPIAFRLLAAAAVVGCASLVLLFSSDVSCLSSTSATTDTYVGRGEPGPPAREEGPAPALEDVGTRSTGVEARSPSADDVIRTIERSKPAELTIVCRDASGRSVAGCSVQATESHGGRTRQTVLTDSEGRTRLPVPPELESLVLSAEDARAGTSGELEVWLASSVRSELELVLRPPRTLRGVVLSEERNPVVGALVHAKLKGRMLGGTTPSVREEVRTDSSGRFSFTLDAVPCLLVVSATKDDGAVTSKDVHWPRDSEDTVSLVFEGEPELQVRGTVRNVAGGVCPGVQVVLSPQEPARGSRTVLSDVSGRFNFQLSEPGVFDLAARGAGYLTLEPVHMEVTLSQQQVQVELLVTESAMISGRVSKPSGEPWGGVQVGAFATSAPEAGAWLLEHRFQAVRVSEPTQTSADGSFEVRDLHPGSLYEVWCLPDPARPQCFVYEEGVAPGIKDLVLLVDEARIRGGVLRAQWSFADGQRRAVEAGLLIYERTPGGEWSGSRRPPAEVHPGDLRVEGLRIGHEYYAELQVLGAARVLHGPWTATNEPENAEFVCGEDGEFEGSVRYSDGTTAKDWLVDMAEEPPGPAPPFTIGPHGPDGTVRFIPVASGRYRVTARSGAKQIGPFEVQIVPRRKSVLDIDVGAR